MKTIATILILFSLTLSFGNPVFIDVGKPIVGGESRSILGHFQKDREYLEIHVRDGDIEIIGDVYYEWEYFSEADGEFFYEETWIDLPFYTQKSGISKKEIINRMRNAMHSTVATVTLIDCRLEENFKKIQKSFRNVEVWMCRYRIEFQVPNSGDFDLKFRYSQDDIREAGMHFNFYIPLFEDGFERERLEDYFKFVVYDKANNLVNIQGGTNMMREKDTITMTPVSGKLIVLSKGQPVAGTDATR